MVMLIIDGVYSDASYMDTVYVDADSFNNRLTYLNTSTFSTIKGLQLSIQQKKKPLHIISITQTLSLTCTTGQGKLP